MVKQGYKQTEIGVIPEDWEVKELGEVSLKIASGKSNTQNYDSGVFPIYGSTGIIGMKSYYDYEGEKITVARVGANAGKINFIQGRYCISDNTLFVQPNSSENIKYLYKYLSSINLNQFVFGSGQPLITGTILKNLQIPLPPLPEQEAIATALSDADAWIASLEQLIAKKRLIKQGAMQELLTPKEDWEVKKLGEVCDVRGGGTPSTSIPEFWNGNILWFTPTEVGYTKYLINSLRKITELGLKNSSANILPVNTILLTSRAGIGDLGILKSEASTNQGFQSLVCKDNVNYEFVYYMMQTKKNELLSNASGSTFLEISPNKVKAISFDIPSLSEQERIASILSNMDAELEALEKQLGKAQQIKQGMMQELLTGRIRLV